MSRNKHIALCISITLGLSLAGGLYTAHVNENIVNQKLDRMGNLLVKQWHAQFRTIEHGLRGRRGAVVAAGNSFNQQRFQQYINSRDLSTEFPTVRAFGVVKRVTVEQQDSWLAQASEENPALSFRQYVPHNDDRYIIQYLAPDSTFTDALGLDLGSDTSRRETFDEASATNSLRLTAPLQSTENHFHDSPNYIAVLPFDTGGSTKNDGWVAAPLFIEDFFKSIDNFGMHIAIEISDHGWLFHSGMDTKNFTPKRWTFTAKRGQPISFADEVTLAGRTWHLRAYPTQQFFTELDLTSAWVVSITIAIFSLLLSTLLLNQLRRKQENAQLEKSQKEQLGTLIDAAPCGMMFLNADYKFIAVNKQLCLLTGYTRRELLEASFQLIMGETDEGNNLLIDNSNESPKKGNGALNFEMMVRRQDGTIFPAAIGISTLKIGGANNIVATLEDVSNRRQIERKIAESEAMFRELANAMPQHVWTADASGNLTYVNHRCIEYFGDNDKDLISGTWIEHIHPEDKNYVIDAWRKSVKSGEEYQVEFRLRRYDGRYFWHMSRAIASKNSNQDTLLWYGTNTDISDARKVKSELEDSVKNTQEILNSILDGIITINEQGQIFTFNNAATDLFGYKEHEVLGKSIRMLLPDSHRTHLDRYLTHYLSGGETKLIGKSKELDGLHRDGSLFKVELRVAENIQQGKRRYIGMVRDITERYYNGKLLSAQDHILGLIARNAELPVSLEALVLDIEALAPEIKASILLLDASETRLLHAAAPSLPSEYNAAINGVTIGPNVGSCGTAAFFRKEISVEDIASDPRWENYRDLALKYNLRSCWSTPIFSKNKLLGTFALYSLKPRKIDEKYRRIINMATHVASLAITHDRRESQIRQLAFYDSLTNLPNRALGMDRLNRAIADAHRRSE